ncbi:MAG: hypothetical protein WBF17_17095 [Phycisphaerae bacterium]
MEQEREQEHVTPRKRFAATIEEKAEAIVKVFYNGMRAHEAVDPLYEKHGQRPLKDSNAPIRRWVEELRQLSPENLRYTEAINLCTAASMASRCVGLSRDEAHFILREASRLTRCEACRRWTCEGCDWRQPRPTTIVSCQVRSRADRAVQLVAETLLDFG